MVEAAMGQRNRRRRFLLQVASAAIILGWFAEGNFALMMITTIVVMAVAGPLILQRIAVEVGSRFLPSKKWQGATDFPNVLLILVGGLVLSCVVGVAVNEWSMWEARSFVERTVPRLDAYRTEHGSFPSTLQELGQVNVPQRLRGESGWYFGSEDHFSFDYDDPTGLFSMYVYTSEDREWRYSN